VLSEFARVFGTGHALVKAWRGMGQHTLKITIHETDDAMAIQLEGRIAGPWVAELSRTWAEAVPRLSSRKVSIDLCGVTYADVSGKQVLRDIYRQTGANLVANSPWAEYLAEEIANSNTDPINQEL
jgi:hypothetical protein